MIMENGGEKTSKIKNLLNGLTRTHVIILLAISVFLVDLILWNYLATDSKLLLIAVSVCVVFGGYAFIPLNDGLFLEIDERSDAECSESHLFEQALSMAHSWKTLNLAWLIAYWVLSAFPIFLSILVIFAASYDVNTENDNLMDYSEIESAQIIDNTIDADERIEVQNISKLSVADRVIVYSTISLAMTVMSFVLRPKEQAYGYRKAYENLNGKMWQYRSRACMLKDVIDAVDIGEKMITGAAYDTFITNFDDIPDE